MIESKLKARIPNSGQLFRPDWVSLAKCRTVVHKLTRGFDLRWTQMQMLVNWPFPQCVTITQHAKNLEYHVVVAILRIKVWIDKTILSVKTWPIPCENIQHIRWSKRHIIHGKVRVTIWRVRVRMRVMWVTIWYLTMNNLASKSN